MTFKEHGRKMLERRMASFHRLASLGAPDNVMATEICLIWRAAEIAFGEELYAEKLKEATQNNRQYTGYCQHCDADINPQLSFPPICEHCDARFDTEFKDVQP